MFEKSPYDRYAGLGFPESLPVSTLRSISHIYGTSKNRCGIYLLEFQGEKYYIGQAVDVVRRFGQHRQKYDNIVGFSFIPTSRKLLDEVEQSLIRKAEQLNLVILNVVHATNVVGDADLDLVITREQQEQWIMSQGDCACAINHCEAITLPESHRERFAVKYRHYLEHPLNLYVTELLRSYINNCVPYPKHTEYSFWAVSCLPATNYNSWPRLACVNAGVMELFVIGHIKNKQNTLWGLLTVASDKLFESYRDIDEFKANFPLVDILNRNYRDAGQNQITLSTEDESTLKRLIKDKAIIKSAATLVLRVMRKRATIYGKYHCKQLADLIQR